MEELERSGMRGTLDDLVLTRRVPVLGICVGMQMLARTSDEGKLPGLGWVAGTVRGLGALMTDQKLPLPHMGWNDVRVVSGGGLFDQLDADARFYFLHSYYFDCDRADDAAAVSSYGREFACAVHAANIYGVQFHPEKSHRWGTRVLQNFASL
jgi:glutamine amidotransferase